METKHTPGPWRVVRVREYTEEPEDTAIASVESATGQTILYTDGGYFRPLEADAALVAAAPDLLDALDRLTEAFPEFGTDEPINGAGAVGRLADLWPVIQAARVKARGV